MMSEPAGRCYQGHDLYGFEMREFKRIGLCELCEHPNNKGYFGITRGRLAADYRRAMRDVDPNDEHLGEMWS